MSKVPAKVTYEPRLRVGRRFVKTEETYSPAVISFTEFDKAFLKNCRITATHTVGI